MRFLLTFLLILNLLPVNAQRVGRIDFDAIREEVSDSASPYFYPLLLQRIWADDTTLSTRDYRYLYYGNVFQPYYHPYGASFKKKEFNALYESGEYTEQEVIARGKEVLKENPVDLEVTLKVLLAYLALEDTAMARVYARKYFGFLDVIYASGDGESLETAYVVISVDDEYRVVGDLGLSVKRQALIDDCDLLVFEKRGQRRIWWKKVKYLYFNVRMPLLSLSDSFRDADLPDPDPDEEEEEGEK